jgi:OPT family oligopeptide transporter
VAMAPDRGLQTPPMSPSPPTSSFEHEHSDGEPSSPVTGHSTDLAMNRTTSDAGLYASRTQTQDEISALDSTNFTLRGLIVGLLIGVIICFSNTYFGLQTGWVSGMAMPASLIGFAAFKSVSKHLTLPFTPVENVLVQTVAGAVGTMPLGLGFVGVVPAMEFLLKTSEGAPINLDLWRLIVWGVGLCLFGVVFGVPLRRQVIVRERLKFPSGTATALMISVLHGGLQEKSRDEVETQGTEERRELLDESEREEQHAVDDEMQKSSQKGNWKEQIQLLLYAFGGSGVYTLVQYFIPVLHRMPIFGSYLAGEWLWTLNPSPAYVGQGIIMGPATTLHMLLGALVGWAILSPMARNRGYASGPVDDWETGSKGWIVWVSLAIMLADAIVNLGWLVLRPVIKHGPQWATSTQEHFLRSSTWKEIFLGRCYSGYSTVGRSNGKDRKAQNSDDPPEDAPPHHLISNRTISWLLPLTIIFCVICIHITFGKYIPIPLNILAIVLALLLSIMGVRALGETDLNPVSGISKLTQLVFALVVPTGKHHDHAIMINLLAGAVSEAGALQAGDIMQDLKAGHLIGASPKAQFYGQLIGSIVGAFVSAAVYKLYVSVYTVPGELFQVPTAYVWIFTARLVTGKGLPPMAWQFALGAGAIFVFTTALRIYLLSTRNETLRKVHAFVPGGIAVAVGMYNTPSFTLARTVGGLISLYWINWKGRGETKVIVLASGLILGEGVVSILNLVLASTGVPHL